MKSSELKISGNLDIFIAEEKNDFDDEIETWKTVLIHGDPEGLRSLANLLNNLADLNQTDNEALPVGAREHVHLNPKIGLSKSSVEVVIGRLDAKGTGVFYERFIPSL